MNTSKISSALQRIGVTERGIKDLTVVDHAFAFMRGIVITGGLFWLILYPYPEPLKFWLLSLFFVFFIYSLIMYGFIFAWPKRIEAIYLACLSLDLIFAGIFIKLSGGFNSVVFLVFYPLVALHSFYYGFFRGIALATIATLIYVVAIHDQWGLLLWADFIFRVSIIFLIAVFLGFISENEKRDKNEFEDPQRKKRYLELIDEALYDIECAVRNLLDYAKRHEPIWEEVDINGVLERTIIMADYKLQKTGAEVKTNFDANLPPVIGDSHQLQEVFLNIILNAIDSMPKGGRLTIETKKIGNFADIKIMDTGVGIRQKDLVNIFHPFYTTKPLGEGTGLGLSVSLEIVKKHDGDISVSSEVGKGTVFSITLPIAMNKSSTDTSFF